MTNVVEGQEGSPVEERLRVYYKQEASVTPPDLWPRLAPRLAGEGMTQPFARRRRLLARALVAAVAAAVVGVALVLWSAGGGGVDTVSADEVVENMRDIYGVPPLPQPGVEGDMILDLGNIQVFYTTDPQTGRTVSGVRQAAGDGTLNADSIAALVAQVGDGFEANLAESEDLDGVEHYVLVLTPTETSPLWPDTKIKLWVEADTYRVTRMSMSSVSGGLNSSGGSISIEDEDLPEPQDGSGTR